MKRDPEILNISSSKKEVTFKLKIDADLIFFSGHFPDYSILPGVIHLRLAKKCVEGFLEKKIRILQVRAAKFSSPVTPGIVSVELHISGEQVSWRITQDKKTSSHGSFIFGDSDEL